MLPSRIRVLFFNLSSPRLEWTRNCNYPGLRERLSNCAASQAVDFALKFQRETRPSIIVFKSQMRYKFLASQVAQSILELDERSEEHTSELQSHVNLVCRLLLEKKKK